MADIVVKTLDQLYTENRWQDIKTFLKPINSADLATIYGNIPPPERAIIFRLLDKPKAVEVFEFMPFDEQEELLGSLKTSQIRDIIEHMSPDDRASLLDELPAKVAKKLLGLLTPEERASTALILGYADNTAGRMMTTEYIDFKLTMTVSEALKKIRRVGMDKETIYYCYVIDADRRLLGIVTLRQLVLADPDSQVADLMEQQLIWANTGEDQEEVAHKIQKYDLLALPVVDREDRLVGIITHDDILDVVQEEATEDIYRLAAVEMPAEQSYFKTRMLSVATHRVGWLLVLLVTNTVTGNIIIHNSKLLETVIALAAFVPLLIGSGGNIGSQTSTVFVRGLALKEVTYRNALGLLAREFGIGLLLGVFLGILVVVWSYWLQGNWYVAVAVGVSMVLISTMAAFFGGVWPLFFKRIGLDPAMVSAPFISTMVDVLGALTYFWVARFILSQLGGLVL